MSSPPQPKLQPWLILLLLLGVTVLTWWPLFLARPALADDYLIEPLAREGFASYWKVYGIWRSAGHPIPFWSKELLPKGDALAALLAQMMAVALFYKLLRRLIVAEALQIGAALVFAAMPFGFQALTWNSALSFVLSTLYAMAALLVSLREPGSVGRGVQLGLLAGFLGFLSISANEASLLLIGWLAFYQIILGGWSRQGWPRWVVAAIILLFEGLWVPLHLATRTTGFHKHVAIHLPALVSGLARQYQQITYFIHLPRLGAWMTVSAGLSALAAAALLIPLWRARATGRRPLPAGEALAFALLPLAPAAVYALGGGFSLDARKAYPIWICLLLASAWFLQAAPARWQRCFFYGAAILCPLLVFSSQITTRAWQQTGSAFETANRQIVEHQWPGPFAFQWEPDIYAAWRDFDLLSGFRFDTPWMLEYAVGATAVEPGPARTVLRWQPGNREWEAVPQ